MIKNKIISVPDSIKATVDARFKKVKFYNLEGKRDEYRTISSWFDTEFNQLKNLDERLLFAQSYLSNISIFEPSAAYITEFRDVSTRTASRIMDKTMLEEKGAMATMIVGAFGTNSTPKLSEIFIRSIDLDVSERHTQAIRQKRTISVEELETLQETSRKAMIEIMDALYNRIHAGNYFGKSEHNTVIAITRELFSALNFHSSIDVERTSDLFTAVLNREREYLSEENDLSNYDYSVTWNEMVETLTSISYHDGSDMFRAIFDTIDIAENLAKVAFRVIRAERDETIRPLLEKAFIGADKRYDPNGKSCHSRGSIFIEIYLNTLMGSLTTEFAILPDPSQILSLAKSVKSAFDYAYRKNEFRNSVFSIIIGSMEYFVFYGPLTYEGIGTQKHKDKGIVLFDKLGSIEETREQLIRILFEKLENDEMPTVIARILANMFSILKDNAKVYPLINCIFQVLSTFKGFEPIHPKQIIYATKTTLEEQSVLKNLFEAWEQDRETLAIAKSSEVPI